MSDIAAEKPPPGQGSAAAAAARILVVEDNLRNAQLLQALLQDDGYRVELAGNGEDALEAVRLSPPDLILLDVVMPGMDGYEVCRQIKGSERTRLVPVVMITALTDLSNKITAIEAGADDFLPKPFNKLEVSARVKSLVRMKRLNDELESAESVVFALARAIEAKDVYTEGHTERVAKYSAALGIWLKRPAAEVRLLRKGGVLHDVGKIGIPDSILNKPGKLTPEEYAVIKQHPGRGYDICVGLRSLAGTLPIIRWHHERLDGTGYPDGKQGEGLPPSSRIATIADVFDALATTRSYKPALPVETCFRILTEEAEKGWWDREYVRAFVDLIKTRGVDFAPTPDEDPRLAQDATLADPMRPAPVAGPITPSHAAAPRADAASPDA